MKFEIEFIQGDGDSKTYKVAIESQLYGDEVKVKKKGCINHVQKRMDTPLYSTSELKGRVTRGNVTLTHTKFSIGSVLIQVGKKHSEGDTFGRKQWGVGIG
ncbi:hypothetical protein J437_LFUL013139 [Ladona fulva]|uniref:Mutator-like transposase domain-containing protein n=1 Tax=Ladona fulva TaxID=123851 RepID=A0A8K0KEX0_LADFU|nr:hypothetical protein J437_LFUL013139 [Ladona fulva]